jgi:hypothetical protein
LPNRPTTIVEELIAAARGVAALVIGDRRAAGYFDFSQRGLAGSFIAFLAATAFSAYLPSITGNASDSGTPISRLLLMAIFLFAVQLGFSALVLRQLNRLDGFIPYVVADNWATFFVTVVSSLFGVFGLSGDVVLLVVGVLVLIIEVNIARLIVTLKPWQIVLFLVAQLVAVSVGLIVIGSLFPLPPELIPAPAG